METAPPTRASAPPGRTATSTGIRRTTSKETPFPTGTSSPTSPPARRTPRRSNGTRRRAGNTTGEAVLAWGGHISTRPDWGLANSAATIPGSPYHTADLAFACGTLVNGVNDNSGHCHTGQQDRSLAAEAVTFPGSITIIKDATPNASTSSPSTASPSPLTDFSLADARPSAD